MGSLWSGGYGAYIPGPLLDDAGLRPRSLILYAHIARRANRVGFCYAANAALIDDMSTVDPTNGSRQVITERTLQSMLAELRDRGHIHVDQGPYPPDKNGVVRTGRRIFIGRCLDAIPDSPSGGEKNFTPEDFFTQGVKKKSPPIKCNNINNKNKIKSPIIPQDIMDEVTKYAGQDQELLEAIQQFLINRATPPKANPVKTPYGIRRLLRNLENRSGGRRDVKLIMIDNAINGNWRDFWTPKKDELPVQAAESTPDGGEEPAKPKRYVRTDVIDGQEVDIYE